VQFIFYSFFLIFSLKIKEKKGKVDLGVYYYIKKRSTVQYITLTLNNRKLTENFLIGNNKNNNNENKPL